MSRNLTVSEDRFGYALDGILSGVLDFCDKEIIKAVEDACASTSTELRTSKTVPKRTGKYRKGWTYSMKSKNHGAIGEVGNRKAPGMAHLLEKGHARIGGGRVAPRVHIAPIADENAEKMYEKMVSIADESVRQ